MERLRLAVLQVRKNKQFLRLLLVVRLIRIAIKSDLPFFLNIVACQLTRVIILYAIVGVKHVDGIYRVVEGNTSQNWAIANRYVRTVSANNPYKTFQQMMTGGLQQIGDRFGKNQSGPVRI